MFSFMCIQLPPVTPEEKLNKNPTLPQETEEMKEEEQTEVRRAGQRDEMTASSVMWVWRSAPVSLILKHFQEQRREEFCGALHLHVQEAAGVAGADHPQIRHLHQQLGPEVGNVVFAVVDVVLEGQQVRLLALLDLLHADQPRPVCGNRRRWWPRVGFSMSRIPPTSVRSSVERLPRVSGCSHHALCAPGE